MLPKMIARIIVARLGTADQLPLLTLVQPLFHRPSQLGFDGLAVARQLSLSTIHKMGSCSYFAIRG
jgi:hypothetical protein